MTFVLRKLAHLTGSMRFMNLYHLKTKDAEQSDVTCKNYRYLTKVKAVLEVDLPNCRRVIVFHSSIVNCVPTHPTVSIQ